MVSNFSSNVCKRIVHSGLYQLAKKKHCTATITGISVETAFQYSENEQEYDDWKQTGW